MVKSSQRTTEAVDTLLDLITLCAQGKGKTKTKNKKQKGALGLVNSWVSHSSLGGYSTYEE